MRILGIDPSLRCTGFGIVDAAGMVQVRVARGGDPSVATGAWPGAAWPVLHRPIDAVISEMLQLADEHMDLGGFRIGNERWLARPAPPGHSPATPGRSPDWAAEFAKRYARDVAIPLRTSLYAPDVTPETAAILARAGCEEARIPLGSGSALIRNEVLGLAVTDVEAAAAVGCRFIGCDYGHGYRHEIEGAGPIVSAFDQLPAAIATALTAC